MAWSSFHFLASCVLQEKQHLEGVVEQQARELQILHAYEQQLSTMTHSLSKLEGSLRQEQEEKVHALMFS